MTLQAVLALGLLPQGLRQELLDEFEKISRNFREMRWEAAELNGGRFCEIVYSVLAGYVNGQSYPQSASKPRNFKMSCEALEKATAAPDSIRLTIPRILVGLYDIRNRRGVGHVGGEVSANHMDATFVVHTSQWVMAELVRIFHTTDTITATAIIDATVDRTLPLIWNVGGVTRVLDPKLPLDSASLVLLYSSRSGLHEKSLAESLEQASPSNYRRVLTRLHNRRLIEFSRTSGLVIISPLGIAEVEEKIIPAR